MRLITLLILLAVVGCASSTPQANKLLKNPSILNIPKYVQIEDVPFILQKKDHCGPATLAMAMNWAGKNLDVDDVAKDSFTPMVNGTFQHDMISTARANGLIAIPITNMDNLLKEVAAQNPVIVFENLAFSWYPQWHYAIVHGYDLDNKRIHMHSGAEKNKRWDIQKFERSWKLGDYWALLVLAPEKLSVTATELDHMRAASSLEKIGKILAAGKAYHSILKKWPNSYMALMGLGNIAFNQYDFKTAKKYYKMALKVEPNLVTGKYNLELVNKRLNNI